uniref:Capsid protein n=1 Tax=Lentinula edodes bipartite virus 1 TaxID=2491350 RepID=A0A9E8AE69_9VIRU|nr:capsid protein [Lentinula edodes bipartite virus 1]
MDDIAALYNITPNAEVSFDRPNRYRKAEVYPDEEDTLDELIEKMEKWEEIVSRGESLAAAFGMLDNTNGGTDWTQKAVSAMLEGERQMFNTWSLHKRFPDVPEPNVDDRGAAEAAPSARELQHITALRLLAGRPELGYAHLIAFRKQWMGLMPLLSAVTKLDAARRGASSGTDVDPRRHQEMLACRLASGVSATIVQRYATWFRVRSQRITVLGGAVHTRKTAVTDTRKEERRPRDPVGAAREALGGLRIGAPTRYDNPSQGGRRGRSGFSGGDAIDRAVKRGRGAVEERAEKRTRGLGDVDVAGPSGRAESPVYRPVSPPPVTSGSTMVRQTEAALGLFAGPAGGTHSQTAGPSGQRGSTPMPPPPAPTGRAARGRKAPSTRGRSKGKSVERHEEEPRGEMDMD